MSAKSELQKIRLYDTVINTKLEELQHLKELTTKITATLSNDPSSGTHGQDKLGDAIAKIVDLENEINKKIDIFIDSKRCYMERIDKLQDHSQIAVLYKRYFDYASWEQIACEIGYGFRHTIRIHGAALQALNKIIADDEKMS